jgi:hypothetical protein
MKCLALEAMSLPIVFRLAFALLGISRAQQFLSLWTAHAKQQVGDPMETIIMAVRIQRVVKRMFAGAEGTCLVRSLALQSVLARRGIDSTLRIGVRQRNGSIEGHAWLEHDGQAINESSENVATYVLFEGATELVSLK